MNRSKTDVREVPGDEVNLTREAKYIQSKALRGEISVIRLGQIVFFSSAGGDAWMLDPADGAAACLVRDFEPLPVPIQETDTASNVRWSADFEIEGQEFIVFESDGSMRTFFEYPTAEIERFINENFENASCPDPDLAGAIARLKVGRNDLCPFGSGRKYKKCCLSADEPLLRQAGKTRETEATAHAEQEMQQRPDINGATPAGNRPVSKQKQVDGAGLAPGELSEADKLWDDFEALQCPTPEQMDLFLAQLLRLPPGEVDWVDLFHAFARRSHHDLPSVFRRIADAIPQTRKEGISFFYWAAVEEFDRRGHRNSLPEVAARFRELDGKAYDPDALSNIADFLLAAGYDAEALELEERFLPVMLDDNDLMPYAIPELCKQIFELRVGEELRAETGATRPVESISQSLRRGIEEEVHEEIATDAAAVITGQILSEQWTRADFDLVAGNISAERVWADFRRLNRTLIRAAREAWQTDQIAPGCAFTGFALILDSVYVSQRKEKRKKTSLLSYLSPSGIEKRLMTACPALIGINVPKARRFVQAHDILCRLAARHRLISSKEADRTKEELSRLHSELGEIAAKAL